ncbi:hypothetical protein NKG05_28455 [Oerskovia sp. M15]
MTVRVLPRASTIRWLQLNGRPVVRSSATSRRTASRSSGACARRGARAGHHTVRCQPVQEIHLVGPPPRPGPQVHPVLACRVRAPDAQRLGERIASSSTGSLVVRHGGSLSARTCRGAAS